MHDTGSETLIGGECAREPIHIPGNIQPFGFLVAVGTDWLIARVSSNVGSFLATTPGQMLGVSLTQIFSDAAIHQLRNMATILKGPDAVERRFSVELCEDGQKFDVAVHFSGKLLVIEAEPSVAPTDDASTVVRFMASRIRSCAGIKDLLYEATRQVRALTGFDRVMVYRFDHEGSGEVVAETRRSGLESYLGLHYPASDIPAQARQLYLRNPIRIIANVMAETVPVLPRIDPTGEPLDLSMSVLRAVSPIHIQYLRNMGVAASMSISIIVDGRLWGLIACHHHSPLRPGFVHRSSAELFGLLFSQALESRERADELEHEERARAVADRLLTNTAQDLGPLADAEWFGGILAEVIAFDGIGVQINGTISLSGLAPTEVQFRSIISFLNQTSPTDIFSTDNIAAHITGAGDYTARAAGLVAIPISRSPRDYVVLFRSERLRAVRWAGNPEKSVEPRADGQTLSPRASFADWTELVRGRALPFNRAELRIAQALRTILLEIFLRLTDEVAEERRKFEERQLLLIAELNHRVRNILALVRGLVSQTRKHGGDGKDVVDTLDLRIQALARAHDLVSADKQATASLRAMLETEASAFLADKRDRIAIQGDDIQLRTEAFTIIALVIHEMVTNATKYGALSVSGDVLIKWQIDQSGDLHMLWREQGGPTVAPPKRRGFGSTIIERSIPHELGGRATLHYRPDGLLAEFVLPARHFIAGVSAHVPASGPTPSETPHDNLLAEKTVLIVEDSLLIALECESIMLEFGAQDVLIAATVESAHALLASQAVDLAVLDFNLGKETSLSVAEELLARSTPIVFATGYGESLSLPEALHPISHTISKPYNQTDLKQAILKLLK